MLRLYKYVLKYWRYLLLAILLLLAEVGFNLSLPTLMSNIVNTGIQAGGIKEDAPRAISSKDVQVIMHFVSPKDQEQVKKFYKQYNQLDEKQKEQTDKIFVDAGQKNAWIYVGTAQDQEQADAIFGKANVSFIQFAQTWLADGAGKDVDITSSTDIQNNIDPETFKHLESKIASMPPAEIQQYIDYSKDFTNDKTKSLSATVNRFFYQQLGANTNKIKSSYILKTGAVMIVFSIMLMLCAVAAGYYFARMGAGISHDLREDVYKKVISLNKDQMDEFSTASLITRTTNDVKNIQMLYTMGQQFLLYAPLLGFGSIIMALRKSSQMSWIIVVAIIVVWIAMLILYFSLIPKSKKTQMLTDKLNLVSRENLSGLMIIRAFSNQKFQEKRFDKANKALTKNALFIGRISNVTMPFLTIVMNFMSLLIIWVGSHQIAQFNIQTGDMMAFISYSTQVITAFLIFSMFFLLVPQASVSSGRILEIFDSKPTILDPENPKTFSGNQVGKVEFKNVSFKYAGAESNVIENVSFTAYPGQTTAFIGSTGCGKSTLINLIPRFYDVTQGSVCVDDIDIRDVTQQELRSVIGYVPQQGVLASGTIADNLRYGKEDATDEEMEEALRVAQADTFVEKLGGLSTEISQKGSNVSGGQRQRLCIARALVKKPAIYIFDDSFSALDFTTDIKLRKALHTYSEQATNLVVAQRVSSIMNAHQIIVLDAGKVVAKGTHKELMERSLIYKNIAESQLSKEELL